MKPYLSLEVYLWYTPNKDSEYNNNAQAIHNNVQASHLAVPRRRGIFLCPCVAREGEARVIT